MTMKRCVCYPASKGEAVLQEEPEIVSCMDCGGWVRITVGSLADLEFARQAFGVPVVSDGE